MILKIIITSLIGTLLHFTYDFSHKNKIVGLFSAVNESTWEHIKIALTPVFIFLIIDLFKYGYNKNILFSYFITILLIIVLIPLMYYGYQLFIKRRIIVIDISIFFIAIIISYIIGYYVLFNFNINSNVWLIGILIELFFYLTFTYYPPKIFLFCDPTNNSYGIK